MEKALIKGTTGIQGPRGPQGIALTSFLATVGALLVFKVAEALFSTGHTVMKQATKTLEKKLQ